MIHQPLSILPAALLLATAAAQVPGSATAQPARSECTMQSLQALTTETVYQRQPMAAREGQGANASGTATDLKFARVRDARFDRSGKLVELIVESPDEAANPVMTRRLLAAEAATWDDATKRWLTTDNNLKFVALPEAPKPDKLEPATDQKPTEPKPADYGKGKKGQTLLASELLLAPVKIAAQKQVVAAGEPPAAEASLTKIGKPSAIVWMVPAERAIAFAVVPHGGKHVPLPWSMMSVADQGELQLATESNASKLNDAPHCKDAMEQPSQDLRQRCYMHYGVACPKWDRPADDVQRQDGDTLGKRDGRTHDR
jgi:hypothetical protein